MQQGIAFLAIVVLIGLLGLGSYFLISALLSKKSVKEVEPVNEVEPEQPEPPTLPPAEPETSTETPLEPEPETPLPPAQVVGDRGVWDPATPPPIPMDEPPQPDSVAVPIDVSCSGTSDMCKLTCRRLKLENSTCRETCQEGERYGSGCPGKCACCCS